LFSSKIKKKKMARSLLLMLLLNSLLVCIYKADAVPASLGIPVTISSTSTTAVYFSGLPGEITLVVTSSTNSGTFTLSTFAQASATLCTGCTNELLDSSVGVSVGLELVASSPTLITDATLTVKVSTTLSSKITTSLLAGCVQVSGSTYIRMDATYDSTAKTITVPKFTVAKYYFVSVSLDLTQMAYGVAQTMIANGNQTLNWASELYITHQSRTEATVTCTKSSSTTRTEAVAGKALGVYLTIASTAAPTTATIKFKYTDTWLQEKGATDTARLAFQYYDNGAWKYEGSGSTVDASAKVIVQTTSHYSEWAVTYKNSASSIVVPSLLMISLVLLSLLAF